ncbi:hypothetical protein BBO99_00003830 [Phytophthora kernoviae]|uniref:Uncharacterized protein n=1 Tax=Phytophthora kernoviae TaxID=325452 RepID=A0A421GT92_9STRA|nr:hypothetical protein BBI17_003897 [Phytophthora kernoviae]RLN81277.1 hypothetical protein BBO99_00003830 [Phytophthora kernoviae]
MVGSTVSGEASISPTLIQQKQAWLRSREELRQAQIVTVKQGLSLAPSLYFGTRRCTYSTVVSIVTTAVPLPRLDPLDPQVTANSPVKPTEASRWAEERAREALSRVKQPDNNQSDVPEARSPYAMARAAPIQQQQTLALVREQRAFMQSLHDVRRARACREHEAALVIQRVRRVRGFLGRREAFRERALQEVDLLVQARRGNVEGVVDLLDGFDPAGMGEGNVDDDLPAIEPADVTVVSIHGGNNVLHLAAKLGHLEVVTLVLPRLLSTAPNVVYARNFKGYTPLALAVINGHERVAVYMLSMTTPLFIDHVLPGRKRTLLHEAARLGLEKVVTKLLQLFPHLFTGGERDAWTQRTPIHEALLVGVGIVQDEKLQPWTRHHTHSHHSLYVNADEETDHTMAVLEPMLAKVPSALLDAQDFLGFTALHIAAARGNLRAATHLLSLGADVTLKDAQDRTAWRVALVRGHDACFQEIRRKWLHDVVSSKSGAASESGSTENPANGAAGNSTTSGPNVIRVATPTTSFATTSLHPQLERELFAACKAGDVAKMRFYIDECEVSVNAVEEIEAIQVTDEQSSNQSLPPQRTFGRSLLMLACERRHLRAVKFLLTRNDLDVTFSAIDGRSALTIAQTQCSNSEIATAVS